MLTYGPSSNILMGEIEPFIDMYIRRTVLNGSNLFKSSLSRGDIFQFQIDDCNGGGGVVTIESPNYGV